MGGYGSGRWGGYSGKQKVENSLMINGYTLLPSILTDQKKGRMAGSISWSRNGEKYASIGYKVSENVLVLSYDRGQAKNIEYTIHLIATKQPKGGQRYWFKCPNWGCKNITAKLYLPRGSNYFACRQCQKLTYSSSCVSHQWDSLFKRTARELGISRGEAKEVLLRG